MAQRGGSGADAQLQRLVHGQLMRRGIENAGAEGVARAHGALDIALGQPQALLGIERAVRRHAAAQLRAVDDRPGGDAQGEELLQRGLHVLGAQRAVLLPEDHAGGLLGLQLVDDAVVGVAQRRRHQPLEPVSRFADYIDAGLDPPALGPVEQPGHLRAVFRVRRVQVGQQQNIADVQDIHVQLLPVDVFLAVIGIGAGMLEEGPLLGLVIAHHRRKGGSAVPLDHGEVDVGVLAHLRQDKVSLRVVSRKARGHQMHMRVQPRQVRDGIADRPAGGLGDPLGDMGQLVLLRPGFNGIRDVHNHVAGTADSFVHQCHLAINQKLF